MSTISIGIIGLVILIVLLMLRVPVALAMGLVGFVGYGLISGWGPALSIAGMVPYSTVANYTFSVIPLFLLMGYFVYYGNLATQMFDSFNKWLGHLRGGVCYATIFGGAVFGAANGSGPASTATLARITIPEMRRLGVNRLLAYGVVASAGPLATMIPPSMLMIIYAIVAEQSVGKLLVAGIVPGILITLAYAVTIYVLGAVRPEFVPKGEKIPLKEKVRSLKGVWGISLLIAFIICGLYFGLFTPTEAGAVGAAAALLIALFSKRMTKEGFGQSVFETIKTGAMIFFIVVSSFLLGYFLGITQIPHELSAFLTSLDLPPSVIMVFIIIMYLILGMFIDMVSALFLTVPIILPAVLQLGFDPIWFGVLVVFLAEISLVTPPFGLSLFVIKGVVKDSTVEEIVKGSIPFLVADFVVLILLFFFPQIVLFLPNFM